MAKPLNPPNLSEDNINKLATLFANMLDSFLQHNTKGMLKHEKQNTGLSQRKISVYLSKTINYGAGAPKSREHRETVCTEGQS